MDQPPNLQSKSDRLSPLRNLKLRLLKRRRLRPNLRRQHSSQKERDVNGLGVGSMANMVMDTSTVMDMVTAMVMVTDTDTDAADHTQRRREAQDLDPGTRRKS